MSLDDQYYMLIAGVKQMALEYPQQVESLPKFVNVVDEVVDDFVNGFYLLPQLIKSGRISQESTVSLLTLFINVDTIPTTEEYWSYEAFEKNERWAQVRLLAREALVTLNKANDKPNLGHITWIEN
ncbi:MAG: hypothetical protein JWQ57_2019 [Mucilaginibacter sp.]|nr:hypothetical protein [Mucilaginibacter sp.]